MIAELDLSRVPFGTVLAMEKEMTSRGTRLENSGWEPDQPAKQYAVTRGLNPAEVWEEFWDYWKAESGTKATKRDWGAAWRTWCRNTVKWGKRGRSPEIGEVNSGKNYVMVGGIIFGYVQLNKIKSAIVANRRIEPDEWEAFKKWQELGNWTEVRLPLKPEPLPSPEERRACIEDLQKRGLL